MSFEGAHSLWIPNHKDFIEAIQGKKKVSVRFYSIPDSGVIDLVCAPLDYGPSSGTPDGVNRYLFWDYSNNNGSHNLDLLPGQIMALRVLGLEFDPGQFCASPRTWSVPREWGMHTPCFDLSNAASG